MTENRRIFWNIVATYGRSLIALVCGLFASRWVLMALGQSDFGLYGVVGGLTAFIAFFNSLLAGAISRFFAFSVGEAMLARDPETGLAECRKWFNTAVFVHTAIPVVVMLVGYPIGVYAVRNWLTIQPDRVEAAVWVFRFVCISCFVGMVNVPFSAMFTAKQYIAELTLYSLITTILNVTGLYYMVCHPGFWLVKYSLWICLISVVPQILICWRATVLFQECRIKVGWLFDASRLRQLGAYAGWQMFGAFGSIARSQGIAILVNKFFGTRLNATMSVANQVAAQSVTLSSALNGAFAPALTTYAGAGDNAKATFYYTADDRVDFRQLIKVLAEEFHVRIEMKQIGVRQEAGKVGGLGTCGRELCCSTWLTNFKSVTTSAAKIQQILPNPQKLAGQCGKLKCCLNFECEVYADALKKFPPANTPIRFQKGLALYKKTDVFRGIMWYCYEGESELHAVPAESVKKIIEMNHNQEYPEKLEDYQVELMSTAALEQETTNDVFERELRKMADDMTESDSTAKEQRRDDRHDRKGGGDRKGGDRRQQRNRDEQRIRDEQRREDTRLKNATNNRHGNARNAPRRNSDKEKRGSGQQ